jgi:probable HAF family extracellular repeat protein
MQRHLVPLVVSLSLLFSAFAAAQDSSYTFTTIDVPHCYSANGINDDGHIVGTYIDAAGGHHGFLLAAGVLTTIDADTASGINNDGHIVGTYSDAGGAHGFLLQPGSFTTIDVPGRSTSARGISNRGDIVGSFSLGHGFLYVGGIFFTVQFGDTFGDKPTVAQGINDGQQIVGTYTDDRDRPHGFLLSAGIYTTVDVPGSRQTVAAAINNHGQLAGTYRINGEPNVRGFVLLENDLTRIDVPDSLATEVWGINNRGQIVGVYADADLHRRCFFATPTSEPMTVAVDIKPGSDTNPINPRSNGKVPVAILTTDAFDANTVDAATVRLGPTGAEAVPVRVAIEDVNHDGLSDLLLHFNTQDTGIECGATSLSLTGQTFSGQGIRGADSIVTVGCR